MFFADIRAPQKLELNASLVRYLLEEATENEVSEDRVWLVTRKLEELCLRRIQDDLIPELFLEASEI